MPSTNNVSPPAGSTTIDSDLKIEVEILALAALRHIASDIAQRIGALNARRPIVIVREDHLDDINKSRAILIQLKGLEDAINAAKERIPKIPSREVAAEKVTADSTRTSPIDLLAPFVSSATAAVQSIANLLAFFRADTEYKGRTVSIDEAALHQAIGGQLLALKVEATLPNGVALGTEAPIHQRLESVLRARAELVGLQATEDKKAVLKALDTLVQDIFKRDGYYDLPRLSTAGKLGVLLEERKPSPLVLTAKVLTAGGKYKIRRHLLTTLFWGDQLSYSGGATVAFSLFDPETGTVLLSDVLFHLTNDVKFSRTTDSARSNLLTNGANETSPLVLPQPIAASPQADAQVSPKLATLPVSGESGNLQ